MVNVPALKWTSIQTLRALNRKQKEVKAIFFESAVFPQMKNWHTKKTRNGSKFGWLIQQMSINQNSRPQTFHRRFVSGSLFVSPCLLECYLQSETKIESDLMLRAVGGTCQWLSHFYNILLKDLTLLHVKITRSMKLLSVCWRKLKIDLLALCKSQPHSPFSVHAYDSSEFLVLQVVLDSIL